MKKNFDFTIASEFQSKVDKSNGRAKLSQIIKIMNCALSK